MSGRTQGQVVRFPVKPVRAGNPTADQAERALVALAWVASAGGADPELEQAVGIVAPEHFYDARRGEVWRWIADQVKRGRPSSMVAFVDAYQEAGDEAEARFGSISEATADPPSGAGWTLVGFARLVLDAAQRRALLAACQEGARACHEMEAADALAHAKAAVAGVEGKINLADEDDVPIGRVAVEWSETIDEEQQAICAGMEVGLPRGFPVLGKFGRLRPGQVEIYAGRPGMGKSELLFTILYRIARRARDNCLGGVVVFSLEMPRQQVFDRWVAQIARVPYSEMHERVLTRPERLRMDAAAEDLASLSVIINDRAGLSIQAMRRTIQRAVATFGGVVAFGVDYLQLSTTEERTGQRQEAVDRCAEGMKRLAKDFDCTGLVAAQLNRACEAREDKRPIASDLRESGGLENVGDRIFGLFRASYYDPEAPQHEAEVICLKNRHGRTGTAMLGWRDGGFFDGVSAMPEPSWAQPGLVDPEEDGFR